MNHSLNPEIAIKYTIIKLIMLQTLSMGKNQNFLLTDKPNDKAQPKKQQQRSKKKSYKKIPQYV